MIKNSKDIKELDNEGEDKRQNEIFGDGGVPIANSVKNPVMPFMRQSKYQITEFVGTSTMSKLKDTVRS